MNFLAFRKFRDLRLYVIIGAVTKHIVNVGPLRYHFYAMHSYSNVSLKHHSLAL